MHATLLATSPWYWRVVEGIQGAVDTRPERYLATVGIAAGFLAFAWLTYLGSRPLKRRYSDELVELTRSLTIMIVALAVAALVVAVWGAVDDVRRALSEFGETLLPGTDAVVLGFVAFITLLATYTLTRVTKRVVRHWSDTGRISPHQRELAHHAIQLTLFFVAVAFIFALFERNPRDLFLGAGVLGVVVGFAARKTLSGVLSGFVILFGRPFEAGDWIAVGDREGIVTEITVFNTQIRTFNEEHVLVPNDAVTDGEVINYSKTDRLRLTTEVGVDYDADVAEAAAVARETMESCEAVAAAPSPDVVLESFGDSAVVVQLRYWIDEPTIQRKLSAQNEVIDSVKDAFEEAGIKIPYPQRELMGREETDGFRVAETETGPSIGDEVERAVRRVEADSTVVEEPVEERYRGDRDAEADGNADGESPATGTGDRTAEGGDGNATDADDADDAPERNAGTER